MMTPPITATTIKVDLQRLLIELGTLGEGKCMRATRVEWTEFTVTGPHRQKKNKC